MKTMFRFTCLCLIIVLTSCSADDGGFKIVESRRHDIPVLDSQFRELPVVTVGIRTDPSADTLDDDDFELITADGQVIPPWKPAELLGNRPEAHQIDGEWWILFAVPIESAEAPMKIHVKSSDRTHELPGDL